MKSDCPRGLPCPAAFGTQKPCEEDWAGQLDAGHVWLTRNFQLLSESTSKLSVCVCVRVCVCMTLCGPMVCSPAGSSVHGILQARILEWVAMPFSRGSSPPRDQTLASCVAGRFFTI